MSNADLIDQLKNPPVMSQYIGYADLYRRMVILMSDAATALEAMEWKPIETAPKDGTRILTVKIIGGELLCPVVNEWNDPCKSGLGSFGWWASTELQSPTHWRHLSSPPTE